MKLEIRYIEKIRETFDQFEENEALFLAYKNRHGDMIKVSGFINGKSFEFFCYADGDRMIKIDSLDASATFKRLTASSSDAFVENLFAILLDMSAEFIKNKANRTSIIGDFLMSDDISLICSANQMKYRFDKDACKHCIEMVVNDKHSIEWGSFDTLVQTKKAIDNYCHVRDSKAVS